MGDMGMARKAQRFQFLRLFVKEVGIGFVMHCQLILSRAAALALVASSLNNRSALLLPPRRPQIAAVSYTHLRAHETVLDLVCRLLIEKKQTKTIVGSTVRFYTYSAQC